MLSSVPRDGAVVQGYHPQDLFGYCVGVLLVCVAVGLVADASPKRGDLFLSLWFVTCRALRQRPRQAFKAILPRDVEYEVGTLHTYVHHAKGSHGRRKYGAYRQASSAGLPYQTYSTLTYSSYLTYLHTYLVRVYSCRCGVLIFTITLWGVSSTRVYNMHITLEYCGERG